MTGDWLSWVRANDAEIMTMLENQASNLVKAATILAESISDYSTLNEKNTILKNLEHQGDQFTHELFTIIDKTFVTPLDKEDISELTSTIDQVLDATYGTSDRMVLFKIQKPSVHTWPKTKLKSCTPLPTHPKASSRIPLIKCSVR